MPETLTRSNAFATRRQPAPVQRRRSSTGSARRREKSNVNPVMFFLKWMIHQPLSYVMGCVVIAFTLMIHFVKTAVRRWPLVVFGGVLGTGLALAIIINAVTMQDGQHPSPMFADGHLQPSNIPVAKSRLLPPSRPQQMEASSHTAAPPKATTISAHSPTVAEDPIAQLIIDGAPPPATTKPTTNNILQVQRALIKLGYAITPDGRNGPATQEAIAAFEKLEALPVTGDPGNAAMRKALSVASGLAV